MIRTVIAVTLLLGASICLAADEKEGDVASMLSSLSVMTTLIEADDYTVSHIMVDRLEEGEEYVTSRYLYEDNDYKVIAIGGEYMKDLDLYCLDASGEVVERDADSTNVPILVFHISTSGTYTFKAKAYKMEEGHDDEECLFGYALGWKRED
jgi:hypothetical protein